MKTKEALVENLENVLSLYDQNVPIKVDIDDLKGLLGLLEAADECVAAFLFSPLPQTRAVRDALDKYSNRCKGKD